MPQETLPFPLTVLELCTGGGGQALGLEMAGFECVGAGGNAPPAFKPLGPNPPKWLGGKQLGGGDERDFFPGALLIIEESHPAAVMLENVAGFAAAKFYDYRAS